MAIFHLSAHERVSRSAGQSSVASAAYIMRAQFADERTGQVYDFRHLDAPQWAAMFSPKDAPGWTREAANAERFFNALELFEKRRDAQIALPLDIALPHELTLQQNIRLAQDYVRETFARQGYVALAAIHPPDHDERNVHLHVLVSLRKIDGHGFARTKAEQQDNFRNRDAYIDNLREQWERLANRHLERHGIEARIDRRTLQEQGIERAAQKHRGPTKSAVVFLEQDRAARAAAAAEIQQLEAQIIDLDAKRAERQAGQGAPQPGDDRRPDNAKDPKMDEQTTSAAVNQNEPDQQLAQRLQDGVPSFRPGAPQPGRYDELKPAVAPPEAGLGRPERGFDGKAQETTGQPAANQNRRGLQPMAVGLSIPPSFGPETVAATDPAAIDRLVETMRAQAAAEAAQTQEAAAAAPAPEQGASAMAGAQRPAQEPLAAEPAASASSTAPERTTSRFLDAIADRFSSFITYLSDLIFPPPPPTQAQIEGMERAAAERQEYEARVVAPVAEQEARFEELRDQMRREASRRRAERERGEDRDNDHDRDR